jgi:transposase
MMANQAHSAVVYGIDLGKTWFHVAGCDATGRSLHKVKLSRSRVFPFFANTSVALIGMEACPGSQWLARRLQALGHTVKIMPAQFVKPYVKSNKNDAVDAEAIAEAVTRPSMRFVQVKQTEQVDLQALHRARDLIVSTRTRLICQMRAFCLEYGIAMRNGAGAFKLDVLKVLNDDTNELTPAVRHLLRELWNQLQELEARIQKFTRQIESIASRSQFARRLLTIPGIGPLGATALLAAVGDGKQFKSGRDMAAWLGLTPAQYSTGGKSTLLGVSKRGHAYVRRLLIHGARSCVIHLDRTRDRLGSWITDLQRRMHINKVVVALANKLARIAWVVLTRPGALYQRVDPAFSGGST